MSSGREGTRSLNAVDRAFFSCELAVSLRSGRRESNTSRARTSVWKMEVDEEIRDTCVASEIRHADSTCTYIMWKIKESRWKQWPLLNFFFVLNEITNGRKKRRRFQENYRCTSSSRNVLCIVCTAKQRAKTLTTISLTLRSLGFKLDQRTLYIMPPFVSPEIWWKEGRNHKFFKFRPFVSGGFPLVASSQTRSR